jgi:hypothetical protein
MPKTAGRPGNLSKTGDPDFRDHEPQPDSSNSESTLADDTILMGIDAPSSPAPPRCARTKVIRFTLRKQNLVKLAPNRCILLKLPAELLTKVVEYVITPKNNRLSLLYRRKPWTWVERPIGSTSTREDAPPLYQPPILLVNRQLSDIAAMVLRRDVVLHITVGHALAAQATLKTWKSLRPRAASASYGDWSDIDEEDLELVNEKLSQHRRHLKRLNATLASARRFRKVVIKLHHHSQYANSLSSQLEGVLRHLCVGTSSEERGWQLNKNYVVIDMQEWMWLLRSFLFSNGRLRVAANVLEVISRFRNMDGFGDRMIVDVRFAQGFQVIKKGSEDLDEDDRRFLEIVKTCNTGRGSMPRLFARFLREFHGRQLRSGKVDWDVTEDEEGDPNFDEVESEVE